MARPVARRFLWVGPAVLALGHRHPGHGVRVRWPGGAGHAEVLRRAVTMAAWHNGRSTT